MTYHVTVIKDNKVVVRHITSEWYTVKFLELNYKNMDCEVKVEEIKSE